MVGRVKPRSTAATAVVVRVAAWPGLSRPSCSCDSVIHFTQVFCRFENSHWGESRRNLILVRLGWLLLLCGLVDERGSECTPLARTYEALLWCRLYLHTFVSSKRSGTFPASSTNAGLRNIRQQQYSSSSTYSQYCSIIPGTRYHTRKHSGSTCTEATRVLFSKFEICSCFCTPERQVSFVLVEARCREAQ